MREILGLVILGTIIISTFWCIFGDVADSRAGAVI